MRADYRIFLDACVLANCGVCDLLLRLSERPRLVVPHWSAEVLAEVLAEVRRTHLEKLKWPEALAEAFQTEIRTAFPDAAVAGYENLLPVLTNHEKDRHVLAAAIRGNCPLIVTFNVKHFPTNSLIPWGIAVSHPQDYLLILYEMEPKQVIACLGTIAGKRKLEVQDVLIRLGKSVPSFSQRLLDDLI
ncbi:MAG: PIN domain-containing protein [Puniceicoccaceae bacterium]|nr:MAG: PIN domain-containing protein [Puniceicoccaceae bacterium]